MVDKIKMLNYASFLRVHTSQVRRKVWKSVEASSNSRSFDVPNTVCFYFWQNLGEGGLTPCPPVPTALRLEPHRYYVGSTGCCACFTRRRKYFVLQVQWIMEFKFNTKAKYFHDKYKWSGHCWTGAWHCLGRGPAWVQPLWLLYATPWMAMTS